MPLCWLMTGTPTETKPEKRSNPTRRPGERYGDAARIGIRDTGDALLIVPLAIEFEDEVKRIGRLLHVAVIVIGMIETMLMQLVPGLHAVFVQLHLFRPADRADQAI